MEEKSNNLLEVQELTAEWDQMFPENWKSLPVVKSTTYRYVNNTGKQVASEVKPFILRCKDSKPSSEEINNLIDLIKEAGEPVAWLCRLSMIEVVDFPEGQDPTVKDFFLGNFDPSIVQTKVALVIYPFFSEK